MVFVAVIAMGSMAGWVVLDFFKFINQPLPASVVLEIGKGWSLARIANTLQQEGLVPSGRWFILLARVEKIWNKRNIQAGEYLFSQGENPRLVLERLTTGDVVTHRLVIPEGMTVAEVGAHMKAQGWQKVEALLADPEITKKLGLDYPSLEGWLFPSTYYYQRGDSALKVLIRMVKKSSRVMNKQWKIYHKGGATPGSSTNASPVIRPSRAITMSRYEVLIMASIIEKETGQDSERRHISAVFHNRLRKKMRLQSDPTVIYGLLQGADKHLYKGNLTRKHLRAPTPYNTYTQFGLPPTPICNPGQAAIQAAMHPDASKDIFFVASGGGFHAFSRTFKEHNANVDRYQRRRFSKKKSLKSP